jgi:hypothetical protein
MILRKTMKNRSLAWLAAMLVTVFAQAESGVTAKDEILLKNG